MSAHMKKRHTKANQNRIRMRYQGETYEFPKKIAEQYKVEAQSEDDNESVDADLVFAEVNKKYTKPGALLKGLRIREGLTQVEMAAQLEVTQSDISQMENGTRGIGRTVAQRIEKLFDVDYRSFLA